MKISARKTITPILLSASNDRSKRAIIIGNVSPVQSTSVFTDIRVTISSTKNTA